MRNVLRYKPYKMHFTQTLYDENKEQRVEMAELLKPILDNEENKGLVYFSDEAYFHLSSVVNKYNFQFLAETNPCRTFDFQPNSSKVIL